MRTMVLRKAIASSIASVVSTLPEAPSIIFTEISFDAMIGYSGEVEVCIMNPSLNRVKSIGARPCFTCTNDACESAASSLCVDWVAKIVGPASPPGADMP